MKKILSIILVLFSVLLLIYVFKNDTTQTTKEVELSIDNIVNENEILKWSKSRTLKKESYYFKVENSSNENQKVVYVSEDAVRSFDDSLEVIYTDNSTYIQNYSNQKWFRNKESIINSIPSRRYYKDEILQAITDFPYEFLDELECQDEVCFVYRVVTPQLETSYKYYFSKADGRLMKVETMLKDYIEEINYYYEKFEITLPTEFEEIE